MIIRKETTKSTNTDAKELLCPLNGATIVSKSQTAGRGRMSKEFFSPQGGLYMSIILTKLPKDCRVITCGVAVILARAIADIYGVESGIKWVNDLFVDGKKIAGILCESVVKGGTIERVVIGIGVNTKAQKIPKSLEDIVGTLDGNSDMKEQLLQRLVADITNFDFDDIDEFMDEYKKRCFIIGKTVTVSGKDSYKALAVDIDNNGGLIVEHNGKRIVLQSGEISVKI